jgi:hypothetical protein
MRLRSDRFERTATLAALAGALPPWRPPDAWITMAQPTAAEVRTRSDRSGGDLRQ